MALDIEVKVDSAEKLAAVAGKPTEHYLFAGEVNQIVDHVKELEILVNQNTLTAENFGSFSNSLITEDDIQDSDKFSFIDSSETNKQKKTSWLNLKSKLTTVFNALFVPHSRTITIGGVTQNLSADRTFLVGGGNDIVFTKSFSTASIVYSDGNWKTFGYPTSFFLGNFDNGTSYGSGSSPSGTPSIVIPSLNYVVGKKLDKFTWNTEYCDFADGYVSIKKYDLISSSLLNGREILNERIKILNPPVSNTQNAQPYSKNKIQFTTSDIVDTPIGAQCSVYFLFLKITGSGGGGYGASYLYFNFN